jgi:hypothetical protein
VADDQVRRALLRRGFVLEYTTLGWNVAGIVVLAIAAISARSVALAGFALDSLIEIGASTVVIWELSGTGEPSQLPARIRIPSGRQDPAQAACGEGDAHRAGHRGHDDWPDHGRDGERDGDQHGGIERCDTGASGGRCAAG